VVEYDTTPNAQRLDGGEDSAILETDEVKPLEDASRQPKKVAAQPEEKPSIPVPNKGDLRDFLREFE
jgi:hypothetical protein